MENEPFSLQGIANEQVSATGLQLLGMHFGISAASNPYVAWVLCFAIPVVVIVEAMLGSPAPDRASIQRSAHKVRTAAAICVASFLIAFSAVMPIRLLDLFSAIGLWFGLLLVCAGIILAVIRPDEPGVQPSGRPPS